MDDFDPINDLDDLMDSVNDIMVIAVAADPETWLPQVVVGIPFDTEGDDDGDSPVSFSSGYAPLSLSPEEAYQIGAYLIQAASVVASFYTELIDKTVDERREIIELESQFLNSSFPF